MTPRLFAAVALMTLANLAAASDPVPVMNPDSCSVLADLALTASVLRDEDIAREQTGRIAAKLYEPRSGNARLIVDLIIGAAYGDPRVRGTAHGFATRLLETCVRQRGDLGSLLGSES